MSLTLYHNYEKAKILNPGTYRAQLIPPRVYFAYGSSGAWNLGLNRQRKPQLGMSYHPIAREYRCVFYGFDNRGVIEG